MRPSFSGLSSPRKGRGRASLISLESSTSVQNSPPIRRFVPRLPSTLERRDSVTDHRRSDASMIFNEALLINSRSDFYPTFFKRPSFVNANIDALEEKLHCADRLPLDTSSLLSIKKHKTKVKMPMPSKIKDNYAMENFLLSKETLEHSPLEVVYDCLTAINNYKFDLASGVLIIDQFKNALSEYTEENSKGDVLLFTKYNDVVNNVFYYQDFELPLEHLRRLCDACDAFIQFLQDRSSTLSKESATAAARWSAYFEEALPSLRFMLQSEDEVAILQGRSFFERVRVAVSAIQGPARSIDEEANGCALGIVGRIMQKATTGITTFLNDVHVSEVAVAADVEQSLREVWNHWELRPALSDVGIRFQRNQNSCENDKADYDDNADKDDGDDRIESSFLDAEESAEGKKLERSSNNASARSSVSSTASFIRSIDNIIDEDNIESKSKKPSYIVIGDGNKLTLGRADAISEALRSASQKIRPTSNEGRVYNALIATIKARYTLKHAFLAGTEEDTVLKNLGSTVGAAVSQFSSALQTLPECELREEWKKFVFGVGEDLKSVEYIATIAPDSPARYSQIARYCKDILDVLEIGSDPEFPFRVDRRLVDEVTGLEEYCDSASLRLKRSTNANANPSRNVSKSFSRSFSRTISASQLSAASSAADFDGSIYTGYELGFMGFVTPKPFQPSNSIFEGSNKDSEILTKFHEFEVKANEQFEKLFGAHSAALMRDYSLGDTSTRVLWELTSSFYESIINVTSETIKCLKTLDSEPIKKVVDESIVKISSVHPMADDAKVYSYIGMERLAVLTRAAALAGRLTQLNMETTDCDLSQLKIDIDKFTLALRPFSLPDVRIRVLDDELLEVVENISPTDVFPYLLILNKEAQLAQNVLSLLRDVMGEHDARFFILQETTESIITIDDSRTYSIGELSEQCLEGLRALRGLLLAPMHKIDEAAIANAVQKVTKASGSLRRIKDIEKNTMESIDRLSIHIARLGDAIMCGLVHGTFIVADAEVRMKMEASIAAAEALQARVAISNQIGITSKTPVVRLAKNLLLERDRFKSFKQLEAAALIAEVSSDCLLAAMSIKLTPSAILKIALAALDILDALGEAPAFSEPDVESLEALVSSFYANLIGAAERFRIELKGQHLARVRNSLQTAVSKCDLCSRPFFEGIRTGK